MKPDHNGIIQTWARVIPAAFEYDDELMDEIYERIEAIEIPGAYCEYQTIPSSQRQSRTDTQYLNCKHQRFSEFDITIRVWATGSSLNASWYLRCRPAFIRALFANHFKDDIYAFSLPRSILDQQELASWSEITLTCIKTATKELTEKLEAPPHHLRPHGRVWPS